jgi:hypothetical protein
VRNVHENAADCVHLLLTVVFASKLSAGSPFSDLLPSVAGTSPLSLAQLSGTLLDFLSDPNKFFLHLKWQNLLRYFTVLFSFRKTV